MPNYENNKIRGTLYITVDVKFPRGAFSEQDTEGENSCCLIIMLWFSGLPNIDFQFWDEMMQLNILYTKQKPVCWINCSREKSERRNPLLLGG